MPGSSDPRPWVLGLSASHNGSAALLRGSEVVVAVQEERLRGRKRYRTTGAGPTLAIPYCLRAAGISAEQLDMVALSVQGHRSDPAHDLRREPALPAGLPVLTVSHHRAHAAGAWHSSGGGPATVLVIDGAGSPWADLDPAQRAAADRSGGWEHLSVYTATPEGGLRPAEVHLTATPHWLRRDGPGMPDFESLGGMYAAVAAQIFGSANDAGKVMGLSAHGFATIPPEAFVTVSAGGALDFPATVRQRFPHGRRWPACEEAYQDLAASVQAALSSVVLPLAQRLRARWPAPTLAYAGGVALNSVLNEQLAQHSGFPRLHIMPAADDAGVAIGAAYLAARALGVRQRPAPARSDRHGRAYTAAEVDRAIAAVGGVQIVPGDVVEQTVSALRAGQIVGWFQGGSELGPRALGGRSILCDPRRFEAKAVLNARVKHREAFRPFAPVVLAEHAADWFVSTDLDSPFMLRVLPIRPDRLDTVPGVAHVDGTGRVQTVSADADPLLHRLLRRFFEETGVPILINTSFNVMGEPIVETPEDALWCMRSTGIDAVALGSRFAKKRRGLEGLSARLRAAPAAPLFARERALLERIAQGLGPASPEELRLLALLRRMGAVHFGA